MSYEPGRKLMPSLLDRLTGDAREREVEVGVTELQMRESVKRDLADLLNAKLSDPALSRDCPHKPKPGEPKAAVCYGTGKRDGAVCGTCCPELKSSVLAYGLPDLTTYDATERGACEQIARLIEKIIARHEPRLVGVKVVVPKQPFDAVSRELRYELTAVLAADPANRLSFVTVLEMVSGEAKIDPPAKK